LSFIERNSLLLAVFMLVALIAAMNAPVARGDDPHHTGDPACDMCHSEGGGGPGGTFPYGVCQHCHHVVNFGPHHDPSQPEMANCGGCHTPDGLHYSHHWEGVCLECHGPVHEENPRAYELTPTECYTREVVTIKGTNFGDAPGKVRIGLLVYQPTSAKILFWSNTEVRFRVKDYPWPSGTTRTKNVWVKVNGVASNKLPLTITRF